MAKRAQPDVIEELESAADRMAHWIGENALVAGGLLVLVLGTAAAWGGYRSWAGSRETDASNALNRVQVAYFGALGAAPGSFEEPELANPTAAAAIREEYAERYREVAREHSGTVAGTLALMELAGLLEALERGDEAAETWRQALSSASGNPGLQGLLYQRVAEIEESRGAWAEAAAAHEAAADLEGFPLRSWALLDAARCRAAAGEPERALELFDRIERDDPGFAVPDHLRPKFRELRRAQDAAAPPPDVR